MTNFPPAGYAPEDCGMKPNQPSPICFLIALIAAASAIVVAAINSAATMLAPAAATNPILAPLMWLLLTVVLISLFVFQVQRWRR